MEPYLNQALAVWNSPEFQALLVPLRTLSSISAMFWMLARLADLCMAGLKRLLFPEVSAMLNLLYVSALAVVYAAMMFNTALQGQWHPSLLWRQVCGFAFMYVMLGVTFTDLSTRRLKPHTPLAEQRGAAVMADSIALLPLAERTYERSGLTRHYRSQSVFETAFRFDPVAGFLNRWYRRARLADGRDCVSVALDPALPGLEQSAAWACAR